MWQKFTAANVNKRIGMMLGTDRLLSAPQIMCEIAGVACSHAAGLAFWRHYGNIITHIPELAIFGHKRGKRFRLIGDKLDMHLAHMVAKVYAPCMASIFSASMGMSMYCRTEWRALMASSSVIRLEFFCWGKNNNFVNMNAAGVRTCRDAMR